MGYATSIIYVYQRKIMSTQLKKYTQNERTQVYMLEKRVWSVLFLMGKTSSVLTTYQKRKEK